MYYIYDFLFYVNFLSCLQLLVTVAFYEYIIVGKEHTPGIRESMRRWAVSVYSHTVVPNLSGTRNRFHGKEFSMYWGWRNGLGMIQAHIFGCKEYNQSDFGVD